MHRRCHIVAILLVGAFVLGETPRASAAQSTNRTSDPARRPVSSPDAAHPYAGRRSADGRREILSVPAAGPIKVDGVLDEEVWSRAEPATDFVQSEPLTGSPATEVTEVRVAYDNDYLYVAAYMHDAGMAGVVVNDIRKDFAEGDQDDFEVLLDTFGDRRNGYVFSTNIEGARHDRQVSLEGREVNQSWDALWDVRTRRAPDGWTAEMRIPFRSLRFEKSSDRMWGINFSRHIRRKNEVDFWSPVPRAFNMNRISLAGNLAGLQTGNAGRDLRIKPYVVGRTVRDLASSLQPRQTFATTGTAGVDLKSSVTAGLTLDLTINPDFGQAEADEQQVNLTQFSQFFPEKRDFFLENSGIFFVGDAARNNRINPTPSPDEDNLLFFSRRIGLEDDGRAAPIAGGLRLTGKLTESTRLGLLTVQERQDDARPATNSSVLRFRQNLGQIGNDVGFILLQRTNTSGPSYTNRVFGFDENVRLFKTLDWNSYVVKSQTPGIDSGDYAWRTTLNHEGNFFHGKGGVMQLGDGFQNDLGYYRRTGVRKWLIDTGIRPRSASLRAHGIREFHPHIVWDYFESLQGQMAQKRLHTGWSTFFNNGGVIELSYNPTFNRLDAPLSLSSKMKEPIPAGGYGWNEWQIFWLSDQSKWLSTSTRIVWGGLYSGTQRTVNGAVTLKASYRLRATFGVQRTAAALDVPNAHVVTSFYTMRANYSFTTNMFVDALSQYDPTEKQLSANVRFNLIHHPLSDLFVVYNDQRFVTADAPVAGRALIVKFTQMFAF